MSRLFWMSVGGAVAVTVARRTRRKLDPVLTAAAPVTSWVTSVRSLRQEFRVAMARREAELQAAFVEGIGGPDEAATGAPRRRPPGGPSWATRVDEETLAADDDDEMIYSF